MASLKDRFLYGASGRGTREPRGEKPDLRAVTRPFLRGFGTMVQYNLISMLFFLPAVAWTGVNLILLYEQGWAGQTPSEWFEGAFPQLSTWLLVMIPLWGLGDVGAYGAASIFCRVIDSRQIRHWRHFSGALRQGGVAAFLLGAGRGALLWMLLSAERFYAAMARENGLFRLMMILGAAILLLILAAEAMTIPALHGAKGDWRRALREGISLALWHMPAVLAALALTVLAPLILLLIPVAGMLIWGAYELVIGLSARQYACCAVAKLLGAVPKEAPDEDEI